MCLCCLNVAFNMTKTSVIPHKEYQHLVIKVSFTSLWLQVSCSERVGRFHDAFTEERRSCYYLFGQRENCPCLYDNYLLFVGQILHQKQSKITTNPSVWLLIHYLGHCCIK